MTRVALGFRLGANTCKWTTPVCRLCGTTVDARGLHGLCCRKSAPEHQRHSHMNDIIWQAVKRAHSNPSGEGTSWLVNGWKLTWWSDSYPLVTRRAISLRCHCSGHVCRVIPAQRSNPGMAASDTAAGNTVTKYAHLATTHICVLISVETGGPWNAKLWNPRSREASFWSHLWANGDAKPFPALVDGGQEGNAIAFKSTFPSDKFWRVVSNKLSLFVPTGLVLVGQQKYDNNNLFLILVLAFGIFTTEGDKKK